LVEILLVLAIYYGCKRGLEMSFHKRIARAAVPFVIIAMVLAPSFRDINAGCDCQDCTNLYNRYNQVNALLTEVCAQKADLHNAGQDNDPFNPGYYDDNLLQTWKDAMGSAKDQWATIFPSGNTNAFCKPNYDGYKGNDCMLNSVKSHEEVHVNTCKFIRANNPGCIGVWRMDFFQKGYLDCMTWKQFYDDEINAYNTELNYLKGELDGLRPLCQAMGQWCKTPDPGVSPSNCPSTVSPPSLIKKAVEYVFGK
jgi:hypothetical protein